MIRPTVPPNTLDAPETPINVLVARLQRQGWGNLRAPQLRGPCVVLGALSRALDPASGTGQVTAEQLAGMTCYTERWVRRCLAQLEGLEIIEWHRGGIVEGKPTTSWVRVRRLVLESYLAAGSAR